MTKCERCDCEIKNLETYFIVMKSSVKCAPRQAFGKTIDVMHVCPGEEFWRKVYCVECYKNVHRDERLDLNIEQYKSELDQCSFNI